MNIKIVIATHKKYRMPKDKIYVPLQVGAEGKETLGYTADNTGDNISAKNSNYCELTGLYWAWKNLECDYLGLAHYRRHFVLQKKSDDVFENVINGSEVSGLASKYRVIVPKKRKYYIETLYSHYAHTHYAEHLDNTRKIIVSSYPEYTDSFDKVMKQTYGYMFNMFIMDRSLVDSYCGWLFDILFKLEKKCNSDELSAFQGRFYGRVSEILFNVWLEQQIKENKITESDIKEIDYTYMEKIDYKRKITSFVRAKFLHKKYEGSF